MLLERRLSLAPRAVYGRAMITIRRNLRRDLATVVLAVTCFLAGETASAWQSQVMVTGCVIAGYKSGDLARDDAWIDAKLKPFQPVDGKPAFTVVSGEVQAQVALALQEIRSVCALYRAGKMSESDADNTLSGHEQTIRDFLDHLEHEARARASLGRVEDLDAISAAMTDVGNVGRQTALMGAEPLAQRAIDTVLVALPVRELADETPDLRIQVAPATAPDVHCNT